MSITGKVVGYVIAVDRFVHGHVETERRTCANAEEVDDLIKWSEDNDAGLEFFTVILGPKGLEETEGFSRSSPPGTVVYQTDPCICGKHAWSIKPVSGRFSHEECMYYDEDSNYEPDPDWG